MSSGRQQRRGRIVFITGTDTGVGKTLLTGMMLWHLRNSGIHALAMKPFCSGGRDDVCLLQALQPGELTVEEMNPYCFAEPVAPWTVLRREGRIIRSADVLRRIRAIAARCECLLVEGSGGLLVPLSRKLFVADLIRHLECETIVVARNRLGTINHTLLTVALLKQIRAKSMRVALMGIHSPDPSAATNRQVLEELLAPVPVHEIAYFGSRAFDADAVKKNSKRIKKTLARMAG